MAPEFTEVLFSLLVSYVGAMEFVFIARSFYHWINQHHKFLDGAAADETLEQMQERMKAAIDVAKSQEFGDYKAMVDGVLYKDGFRVDPDTVAKESERQVDQVNREVIGSSRDSAEEERQEVQEEPCVKKIVTPNKGQRISKERSPMPNETPSDANLAVAPQPTPEVSAKQTSEPLPEAIPQSIRFDEYERQAPDGEDHVPAEQFSEDYLRSLDGIKNRRLVRDDGTGRRRSFKKRRSSDDSISSIDSRKSREEEVQMFTSLEEEEFENMKRGDSDYVPIRYSSDTSLKVGKPSKRHSKSPMKDVTRRGGSNEPVEEEAEYDPWGEVKPEHYKDTQFWKREKNISIEEERDEDDVVASMKLANNDDELGASSVEPTTSRRQMPKESSFEQATSAQNQEAIESLQKIGSKNSESKRSDENSQTKNLIFSGEYTKAMSKDWHSGHFCCWQCDESLTGQRYVIRDDHPYCIKCYENVFANSCEECNKIIGIDSKDLSYKDKHWHEACFLCNKCRVSLVDKQFGAKAEKIYCGNCYDAQFASRCDGCGEVFRAGTKKMEYKTRQWHEKCFCCCVCKTPIGTKSFIPREQEIYCAGCYEEKFATRCIKCSKIITSGGVTYKNEPWHRECFTCTHCSCTLAGQRFTSRDDKPYCAECFGELFAKRCTACTKPITGIGGTRFISFEDRHWHHDCFICASCKTSLVGRGFITDGPDIICPECAKQRMM